MRESEIEKGVTKWAREHDILPLKLTPHADGGWPDHLYLYYGSSVVFIEFKAPGKKPDLRQKLRIAELRRRGILVKVIDSISEGTKFLEAAFIPSAGSQAYDFTGLRGIVNVPRDGEDDNLIRSFQDPKR